MIVDMKVRGLPLWSSNYLLTKYVHFGRILYQLSQVFTDAIRSVGTSLIIFFETDILRASYEEYITQYNPRSNTL